MPSISRTTECVRSLSLHRSASLVLSTPTRREGGLRYPFGGDDEGRGAHPFLAAPVAPLHHPPRPPPLLPPLSPGPFAIASLLSVRLSSQSRKTNAREAQRRSPHSHRARPPTAPTPTLSKSPLSSRPLHPRPLLSCPPVLLSPCSAPCCSSRCPFFCSPL